MKKHCLRFALALVAVVIVCGVVWGGYWFLRRDCICYKARFYSSEFMPIDGALSGYASPQSGVMQVMSATCEHGKTCWLMVQEESYSVKFFSK